jgi:multisubunit Na+/H+ antiporter MnhG subunit
VVDVEPGRLGRDSLNSLGVVAMNTVPTGPPTPPPVPVDLCNAPACVNAKAELNTARTAFKSACDGLSRVTSILRFLAQITKVPLWSLIVIVILAIVLWFLGLGWLAVILWALILIYLIALILSLVLTRVAASMGGELAQRADEVQKAIVKVIAACPETCRGDLTVPICNP